MLNSTSLNDWMKHYNIVVRFDPGMLNFKTEGDLPDLRNKDYIYCKKPNSISAIFHNNYGI